MRLLEDKSNRNMQELWDKLTARDIYNNIMGIKEFKHSRTLWIKRVVKYRMRKNKEQGYSQVDWKGLVMAKHRR